MILPLLVRSPLEYSLGTSPQKPIKVVACANLLQSQTSAESMSAIDALETLGLERARNLAITFFALNYENPKSATFDWAPLWRHQVSVGVVMDFMYDALDLKRCGLEYAAGTFHDIGKMLKPHYFIENQDGENRHDSLEPAMSTLAAAFSRRWA